MGYSAEFEQSIAIGSSGVRSPGFGPEGDSCPKEIKIISTLDFTEVERRLRSTPLKDNGVPGFYPYRSSKIILELIDVNQLHPCSLYALSSQLNILRELRRLFLQEGLDILNLTSDQTFVTYNYGGKDYAISPPVIEVSEEDGSILVITDGLHRILVAKELGLTTIRAIKIENTAAPLPVLPVDWSEIKLCDTVPSTEQKRKFRFAGIKEIWQWIADHQTRFNQGFDPQYFFYRSL